MNNATTTEETKVTVGLDLGDRHIQVCVLDGQGEVQEESRLSCSKAALTRRFANAHPARMVLEAGTHSPWVSRLLSHFGHQVLVANPRKLRLIYKNETKSDRVDAEYLARVGRMDPELLSPIHHRSPTTQQDLLLLRSRDVLVRTRTRLISHVRSAVKSVGGRLPRASTETFADRVETELPAELTGVLGPVIALIRSVTEEIKALETKIEGRINEHYPETHLLTQVPGVGNITALSYLLTVEDPGRFPACRAVSSYLGLCPRRRESGGLSPELGITKTGDEHVRRLLVGAAHYILGPFGPDSDLRRWGLKIAERGGKRAKKRAAVAVARKLSVLLLRLWQTGEVYEPLRNARLRGTVEASAG